MEKQGGSGKGSGGGGYLNRERSGGTGFVNLAGLSPNGRRRESEGERKSIMCEGRTALVFRCHGRGFVWIESKMEENVRLSLLAIMD